ncbi:MAG: malto-oligosyltrehalose trehalohydrolase [Acidobacteria bacterium 13_1_20CM_2_57_8]|nr:MAG: malto-oligosyltrehalose trehalohydrolase [Acidobacteria bacterium 13_1_20CM_2_57_8]
MLTAVQRRLPVGAEASSGGVHFRVWAPRRQRVEVIVEGSRGCEMEAEPNGYFSCIVESARPGMLYRFRLDHGDKLYPDPASRFQPEGVHGPSQIVTPSVYHWKDESWNGVSLEGQVIYEMHIGTFTREATWNAAQKLLPQLADTGVTLLEIMPIADFPGAFGWGYDGVDLFAPTHLYGTPDDFRAFVDRAHSVGLGVILDVVYNHFGPDGNYLKEFSEEYFTTRYQNEWGEPINFDGPNSGPVRDFFASNAFYWVDEFHLDGLRLDATQQIFDSSPEHILTYVTQEARRAAGRRQVVIVAENEPQDASLVRPPEEEGCGLDAVWNDDFHHSARVSVTGHNEAYYSDYAGTPQELISAVKWGFLYAGQYYTWQRKRRGSYAFDLKPASFVTYIQNHDQIANSPYGARIHEVTTPGRYRALTALMLLSPGTPMLFQGQEFGASSPFLYFADHNKDLAPLVAKGRAEFIGQFGSVAYSRTEFAMGEPHQRATYEKCKLKHSERKTNSHIVALHQDLLKLRRDDPVFSAQRSDWIHGAVLGPEAFALRFLAGEHGDRLVLVNFGRDLRFSPAPEPLLAPPRKGRWEMMWSSEDPKYGGCVRPPLDNTGIWDIPGHCLVVMYERAH